MQSSLHFTILIVLAYVSFITASAKSTKKQPVILNEDSWSQILEGEWMVDFFAPWCPACKKLEPEWRKFAEWSDDLNINIASADVTANPGLTGRFMISGLPTIYHVKDGVFRIYGGSREFTALINFVEEQGFKAIEPVSRWWSPNTFQMSLLAYSFRVSMSLRDVHNYLVEDFGLPYYISYLIFALCTVTLGTVLGLVIVFIVDQFCPARYAGVALETRGSAAEKKKTAEKSDSDLDDTTETETKKDPTSEVRRRANVNN